LFLNRLHLIQVYLYYLFTWMQLGLLQIGHLDIIHFLFIFGSWETTTHIISSSNKWALIIIWFDHHQGLSDSWSRRWRFSLIFRRHFDSWVKLGDWSLKWRRRSDLYLRLLEVLILLLLYKFLNHWHLTYGSTAIATKAYWCLGFITFSLGWWVKSTLRSWLRDVVLYQFKLGFQITFRGCLSSSKWSGWRRDWGALFVQIESNTFNSHYFNFNE
jgi:hypothetical protein